MKGIKRKNGNNILLICTSTYNIQHIVKQYKDKGGVNEDGKVGGGGTSG